ncbi:hypothetical protein [Phyllobacterium myrsinacearum]|uniref:Uncharacterized protein n=1 Tax=Phyllobacterium myrsinacearum TaxID=28101 RepID=A0A839EGF1_9HYPH|nr:hypothetical protein [Phyllobacterium myrsinacearum]MBA8877972.1 hypothetical protein [Phyllobacterium myrsinacearum]
MITITVLPGELIDEKTAYGKIPMLPKLVKSGKFQHPVDAKELL